MNKEIQLFLLPFAGGSSTSFTKLISCLDERINAVAVEYAGRGTRSKEPLFTDYQSFFNDIVNHIRDRRNENVPFALLGYSLGGALAFEIAAGGLIPGRLSHVVICARDSISEPSFTQEYSNLTENEFAEKIKELGGVDERILKNKRFRDIYFKPLHADYEIWNQFQYDPDCKKMPCDITVLYSDEDNTCKNPVGWTEFTKGKADFYEIGHNHFFINDHYKEMAEIINRALISRQEGK